MRAMMALVLHLGGVGEYVTQSWGQSVHPQESGDLHTLAATFEMWGKYAVSPLINLGTQHDRRSAWTWMKRV